VTLPFGSEKHLILLEYVRQIQSSRVELAIKELLCDPKLIVVLNRLDVQEGQNDIYVEGVRHLLRGIRKTKGQRSPTRGR